MGAQIFFICKFRVQVGLQNLFFFFFFWWDEEREDDKRRDEKFFRSDEWEHVRGWGAHECRFPKRRMSTCQRHEWSREGCAIREYHGFGNPWRVGVAKLRPSTNPYPQDGLAGFRGFFHGFSQYRCFQNKTWCGECYWIKTYFRTDLAAVASEVLYSIK